MSQRNSRHSSLLLLIFEFNKTFKIDIIDNIIYASGTCHQNSNQWQCSIIVTGLRLYHVTSILHCHWKEFWSQDTDGNFTYIRFGINSTQSYVNFSRQEHQIDDFRYRSTPGILRFQPISPFMFPLHPFKQIRSNSHTKKDQNSFSNY